MSNNVTLKEKIGQMILVGFKGLMLKPDDPIVHAILAQQIGGVILFDYDCQTRQAGHRNIQSPEQLKTLTQQLQTYAKQAATVKKNHLSSLIISIDYEGGKVNRLKESYGFPKTQSAAEIGNGSLENAKREAEKMAATLKGLGINLNFAPVLDLNVNPDNPIIGKLGRSFSSDPKKVIEYAAIFAKAYQDQGVLCAYKHFPGHGSSVEDTHTSPFVDVTDTWKEYELDPYKALINNNPRTMIMTAHVVNKKYDIFPASISKSVTTDLLRNSLNFKGVTVTDDMQMDAMAKQYGLAESVKMAVNAGADILVFGNQLVATPENPQEIVNIIDEAVQLGQISEERIDESYQRIQTLKQSIQ